MFIFGTVYMLSFIGYFSSIKRLKYLEISSVYYYHCISTSANLLVLYSSHLLVENVESPSKLSCCLCFTSTRYPHHIYTRRKECDYSRVLKKSLHLQVLDVEPLLHVR